MRKAPSIIPKYLTSRVVKPGPHPKVKRQPWTVSHGFGDEGLTGRIEDLRDDPQPFGCQVRFAEGVNRA
jgi:hypothetical protein